MRSSKVVKTLIILNIALFSVIAQNNITSLAYSEDYSNTANKYYNRGSDYLNSNNYPAAITQLEQALKLEPGNASIRNKLAGAYINNGANNYDKRTNLASAANDFRKAIFYLKYDENIFTNEILNQNLKIANINLNKALYAQNIQSRPKNRYKIAKELRGQGNFKEAIVEFVQASADKSLQANSFEAVADIMRVLQRDFRGLEYYEKALSLKPDKAFLHLKIARTLQKLDNIDNAVKEYNIALNLDPGNTEIISALENLWRKKLQENPKDDVAHMNLGVVLQKKKDFEGALAQYKAAEMINPNSPTLRLNMGTLFQAKGNLDMAVKAYNSILQVTPDDPQVHFYKATALKEMGNIKQSIDEFQTALRLDPKNLAAKKGIFEAVKKYENKNEALAILRHFSQNNPSDAFAQYNYAYELHSRKKIDEALKYYNKTLAADPSLIDAYLNIASIYREKNQNNDAISTLQNALEIDPNNTKAKNLIAQIKESNILRNYTNATEKQKQGDYTGAIEDYKKIIEEGNADSDVYVSLGSAYQASNNLDEAIKAYNKAIELDKNNSSAFYYLGAAHYSKKNYKKASEYYQKALTFEPENNEIKNALKDAKLALLDTILDRGLDEFNSKRYTKAMETFNYVVKNDPSNGYAYYYRAMIHDALNRHKYAIRDYKKAIIKTPDLDAAYYGLAVNYDLLKNYKEAKKLYKKFIALSKDPNDEYVKYAKQRVKSIK